MNSWTSCQHRVIHYIACRVGIPARPAVVILSPHTRFNSRSLAFNTNACPAHKEGVAY